MAGVAVTFAVTGGGGTASGSSVTSDAQGVATIGSWTLGTAAGPNTLSASSGTLTPVSFSATGTAGAAASMVASAGNNQAGNAGGTVPIAPAVIIKDANGNPKPDVVVTFVVGSGGGSITGETATSNAAGIATVGSWTLGSAGINTLIASATGLPSVTFSANAVSPLCFNRVTHVFGTTSNGTLAAGDCQFNDGSFVDFFTTTVPQADMYFFREKSAGFNAYIVLGFPDGSTIAENDASPSSTDSTESEIKALLPAGTYLIGANSLKPNVTGDYSISTSVAPPDVGNCDLVFTVKGISTTQKIEATDCLFSQPPAAPIYADLYFVFLKAGDTITINMSSTNLDSYLNLVRQNGTSVASNDNKDGTTSNAQIVFTVTATDYYAIFARTAGASQVGTYTLSIQ
jgi:hypothetical protein